VVSSVTGAQPVAGVHLEEIEFAVIIGEELDRAGAGVADRARGQPGRVEELGPHTRCAFYQRRRASSMIF